MNRTVVASVLGVVCGIAGLASADSARFVLVPRTTPLYSAPHADANSASDPDAGDVDVPEDEFWALRKVRELPDGWIEVATGTATTARRAGVPQCYGAPDTDGLELHLYVRAKEIVEATTRPVVASFSDGTSVRLDPGVAVGPAGPEGARPVMVDGLRFTIPISAEQIGTSYTAEHLALMANPNAAEYVRHATLSLDNGKRTITVDRRLGTLFIHRRAGSLVDVNLRCSSFTAAMSGDSTKATEDEASDAELDLAMSRSMVRGGAVAYWPTGEIAGRALHDTFMEITWISDDPGRRCFAVPFRGASFGGGLVVCFRTRDVRDVAATRSTRGHVSIDPAQVVVTGGQLRDDVVRAVRKDAKKLQRCYTSSPAGQRSLTGTLALRIEVNASGEAERYMMLRGFEHHLDQCVIDLLGSFRFSATPGLVTLPLNFAP